MKFSQEILIDLPRDVVSKKLQDPSNYKYWQRGFISYIHLTGLPGKEGARSRLKFKMGNREIEMIESILKIVPNKKFYTTYEASGVFNTQKNHFENVAGNKTRWIADSEFRFSGFMRIIGLLKPGAFKKQSRQFMEDFKNFAERGVTVLDKKDGKEY